jgi:HlyD family secretion protein
MPSKDLKPKQRLGQVHAKRNKIIAWTLGLLFCGGVLFAGYRYAGTTEVEVPVARVRRGDFIIAVRTRGEIKSTRSVVLSAPNLPNPRITHLAHAGSAVKKGDVVVEFDAVQLEQFVIQRTTVVRQSDTDIDQMKATHRMDDQQDAMNLMSGGYDVERAKLDASKAEVLSQIDGEKNRIQVGVAEGALSQNKAVVNAHQASHAADLSRLNQRKDKAIRDLDQAQRYLNQTRLVAPIDGYVNVLPNFRGNGSFGQSQPPFKEGDNVWTGAPIVEIPDLSQMYVDIKLEEVDRGKLKLGQRVRVRVDAIPDKEFSAELDWISPIASLVFTGNNGDASAAQKTFPARATLKNLDPRLRPGMSATAEVIIEQDPGVLMIPARSSFTQNGKPAVYVQTGDQFQVRPIEVGKRNDEDEVVTGGLKEGEMVTLESPEEAAKRARKKL